MYGKTLLIFFFTFFWMGADAMAQSRCVGVHKGPIPGSAALSSSEVEIFLDTNILDALVAMSLSAPGQRGQIAMFDSLVEYFGATRHQFFNRQDVFSRIGMVPTIRREFEIMDGGLLSGSFPLFQRAPNPETLRILERANIGGGRGVGDRHIIAELLALSQTRDTPIYFFTADRKVINGLCRFSRACIDPQYGVQRFSRTGFEIEINGSRLVVVPIFTR